MNKFLIFIFFSTLSFSQTKIVTGVVTDTLNKPLESANVLAKPQAKEGSIKFAIADNKGRYKLELEANLSYEISVAYLGYVEQNFILEAANAQNTLNFLLTPTGENLKEIIINYEYKPIIVKKDTLIYDVKSFANGNERKLKEQLEKLPGVEVDKNGGVTVQGKKVTKFLVEGDVFFGGGTKLGVENIPANAVDKVEVIDHFNEVGFMKQVSDSEDLAMNIKLKEEKKKFIFGDVEAATEVANDNGYYLAHAALFYYSPVTNLSFIGDSNNIGRSTFTFEDLMRFDGGASSFLTGRKSLTNLYSFATDNQDVVENRSHFGALNFNHKINKKVEVSGYYLSSNTQLGMKNNTLTDYLKNETQTQEQRVFSAQDEAFMNIANVKLEYSPKDNSRLFYNGQYQWSDTQNISQLLSATTSLETLFNTARRVDNTSFKQYIEWHKSYSKKHTTTLVINNAFENSIPQTNWFTNQPFLAGLIPLENDETFTINQIKRIENSSLDVLFKHYWVLNNYNHLYTIVGSNLGNAYFFSNETQSLSNGSINNFSTNGFGNAVNYWLNDSYIGLEYKFKIGKTTHKPGLYYHSYLLRTTQPENNFYLHKLLFQPQWNTEIEINKSENVSLTYRLANTFADAEMMAENFILQNYNAVFKGNALLENERFHQANLRYSKFNMYRGIMLFAIASVNHKVRTKRNEVILEGINQFTTPILTQNPETNWNTTINFSKKIYRFTPKITLGFNGFTYLQKVNLEEITNVRNNQNIGLSCKTSYKKWPTVEIGYTKTFSQFNGLTNTNFSSNAINASLEAVFLKNFTLKFDYENLENNTNQGDNFFQVANASLRYQKNNSPFTFELSGTNLFNTTSKNNFTFSDFTISQQAIFILPRIVMFSISYKL